MGCTYLIYVDDVEVSGKSVEALIVNLRTVPLRVIECTVSYYSPRMAIDVASFSRRR